MTQDRIIYPQPGGPIAVVTPLAVPMVEGEAPRDAMLRHARHIVPAGQPFRLISSADLPADRSMRAAWTADFSAPDGVGERVA